MAALGNFIDRMEAKFTGANSGPERHVPRVTKGNATASRQDAAQDIAFQRRRLRAAEKTDSPLQQDRASRNQNENEARYSGSSVSSDARQQPHAKNDVQETAPKQQPVGRVESWIQTVREMVTPRTPQAVKAQERDLRQQESRESIEPREPVEPELAQPQERVWTRPTILRPNDGEALVEKKKFNLWCGCNKQARSDDERSEEEDTMSDVEQWPVMKNADYARQSVNQETISDLHMRMSHARVSLANQTVPRVSAPAPLLATMRYAGSVGSGYSQRSSVKDSGRPVQRFFKLHDDSDDEGAGEDSSPRAKNVKRVTIMAAPDVATEARKRQSAFSRPSLTAARISVQKNGAFLLGNATNRVSTLSDDLVFTS